MIFHTSLAIKALSFICLLSLKQTSLFADIRTLREALTHHAPFDESMDAAYSRGDRKAYIFKGHQAVQLTIDVNDVIKVVADCGKFGGALLFLKKNPFQPYFRGPGVLNYTNSEWSGTVSIWLRLTPDVDLQPGYCDPIQIVGGNNRKGYIFLEWSKDETPREFRYAVRPLFENWNPHNKAWSEMTDPERPIVNVKRAPFLRSKWTHTVFTFSHLNSGQAGSGKLYINGELQGTISGWDFTFGWQAENVLLVLGAAYVGLMDDLAVFDRALTSAEIKQLFELANGIESILADSGKVDSVRVISVPEVQIP